MGCRCGVAGFPTQQNRTSFKSNQGLGLRCQSTYNQFMSEPTDSPVSEWLADLEISEAQAAAGEFVSGEKVLADLKASIARLKVKLKSK